MSQIHPLALVSPRAEIGRDVTIGPFCVVESDVQIGDRCSLGARVSVKEGTRLGADNEIAEGVVLGGKPQHKRAGDHLGELIIGQGNMIREFVTIHRGLHPGGATTIGDANLIMVQAHIAHDCSIGHRTVIANNVMLAGHVAVGEGANLSGAVGVHQFCRVGQFAMVGGQAHVNQDIPPYVTVDGESTTIVGLNVIGLRRAGFTAEDLDQLKQAYRIIFRSGMTWNETLRVLAATFDRGPAAQFHPFLSVVQRGFLRERRTPRSAAITFPQPQGAEAAVDTTSSDHAGQIVPLRHAS